MWEQYGQPSLEFTQSKRGNQHERIREMRDSINLMFAPEATNSTITAAFESVSANWRDFSLEFVSISADPKVEKKGEYDF